MSEQCNANPINVTGEPIKNFRQLRNVVRIIGTENDGFYPISDSVMFYIDSNKEELEICIKDDDEDEDEDLDNECNSIGKIIFSMAENSVIMYNVENGKCDYRNPHTYPIDAPTYMEYPFKHGQQVKDLFTNLRSSPSASLINTLTIHSA